MPEPHTQPSPTRRRWWLRSRAEARARSHDDDEHEPFALRVVLPLALSGVSAIASWMASAGQLNLADKAHITGPLRYGVPVIFDLFAVVLVLLGYRQGRRQRSPYPLWSLAAVVGLGSAYLNFEHTVLLAGVVFGGSSIASIVSWFVKYRIDLTHYLVGVGKIPPQRPRFGKLALVSPRLHFHSWRVSHRRRVTSVDEAVRLAEVWIAVFDDMREVGKKRKLAARVAWRHIDPNPPDLPHAVDTSRVQASARPLPTQPVAVAPTTQPVGRRAKPTSPRRPNRPAPHTKSAIENAAEIRRFYGAGRPKNTRQVRTDLKWSHDKAAPAFAAYVVGADLDALVEAR